MIEEEGKPEMDRGADYLRTIWTWTKERTSLRNLAFLLGLGVIGLSISLVIAPVGYLLTAEYGDTKEASEALRNILLGAAAAIGGPFGFWLAWQRTEALKKDAEIKDRTHYTDLFTKAVELLTSNDPEVRLGGIFSLEKIALERKDFHWPVMEVISSYIRTQNIQTDQKITNSEQIKILNVIGRRSEKWKKIEKDIINLSGITIHSEMISDLDLSNVLISNAELYSCVFKNVKIDKSAFYKSNMDNTSFGSCSLNDTGFSDIISGWISFIDCKGKLDIRQSSIKNLKIVGHNSIEESCQLTNCEIESLSIETTKLKHITTSRSLINEFQIIDTNLKSADVRNSSISKLAHINSNAKNLNIKNLKLRNTDLSSCTKISQAMLETTQKCTDIKLPPHLKKPDHWD